MVEIKLFSRRGCHLCEVALEDMKRIATAHQISIKVDEVFIDGDPALQSYVDDALAANTWAGTTGLDVVGALNVKAGNTRPNYKDLRGVCNQLGGTTDKAPAAALRARES